MVSCLRFGGESCGFGTSGAARARNISTGAKVVVVGQTVAADVDVVNSAMNHGCFGTAEVAPSTDPLRLRLGDARGRRARLDRKGFHVQPTCNRESAQRKYTYAEPENTVVGMRAKSCRLPMSSPENGNGNGNANEGNYNGVKNGSENAGDANGNGNGNGNEGVGNGIKNGNKNLGD